MSTRAVKALFDHDVDGADASVVFADVRDEVAARIDDRDVHRAVMDLALASTASMTRRAVDRR